MSTAPDDHPPTVLIVDDDRATQTLLAMAMEEEGYATVGAQNGEQALEEFGRLVPSLVLMDAMMPEMDGFTCCERLRSLPEGKTVPILIITVLDDQESVDRAFAAGTTDYITKPIYWPVLCQRVRRLVQAGDIERKLGSVTESLRHAEAWEGVMEATLEWVAAGGALEKFQAVLAIARQALDGDRVGLWMAASQTWLEDVHDGGTPLDSATAQASLAEGVQGNPEGCLTRAQDWPTLQSVWLCRWGMVVALGDDDAAPLGYLGIGRSADLPWDDRDQRRWQRLGQLLGVSLS